MASKFYIGCVAYNNAKDVLRLAQSLAQHVGLTEKWCYLLLDHSDDLTEKEQLRDICLEYKWRYLSQPNRGFGAGVNALAKALCRSDMLLICNGDLVLRHPPPFQNMFAALVELEYDMIGTSIADGTGKPSSGRLPPFGWQIVGFDFNASPSSMERNQNLTGVYDWHGAVHGACFAFEVGRFLDSGGVDENLFLYGEEFDLQIKFQKKGFRIGFVPSTSLLHASEHVTNQPRNLMNLYNLRYLALREQSYLLSLYFTIKMGYEIISSKRFDLCCVLLKTNVNRRVFLNN